MKIAVLGAGAIGIYYGVRLALAGNDVRFLLRSDLAAVRARGSLIVHLKGGKLELPVGGGSGARVAASAAEIGPVDLVLIAAKVMANEALQSELPPLLGPETAILTLQNGLGADEYFAKRFGAERVFGGLAYIANNRIGPGEVLCNEPGYLTIGSFRDRHPFLPALAAAFQAAGVRSKPVESLASARWHKLVWNVPFNGLAAATRLATDRILADPALAAEARGLMKEVQAGARALGYPIADAFLQQQFDLTAGLGAYQPSTLVDVLAGREIEVEAIWGEPLRRAQAAGAHCPRLQLLYALIKRA